MLGVQAQASASAVVVAVASSVAVVIVVGGYIPSSLTCYRTEYLFSVQMEKPLNKRMTYFQIESLLSVRTTISSNYQ